ncbi:MAG: hypothetical protein PVF43_04925 [Candidatus Eiseniibacteriota bacterium]|jgi:hypothetical protein
MARREEKIELRLPEGVVGIRNAKCPKGCSLMDPDHPIHGLPSIKVMARGGEREGLVHLDPVYGRFDNVGDWDPPKGTIVEFECPSCGTSLGSDEAHCQACGGPMFQLQLPSGIVEGCLRRGCLYHRLTIVDSDALLQGLFEDHHFDAYL